MADYSLPDWVYCPGGCGGLADDCDGSCRERREALKRLVDNLAAEIAKEASAAEGITFDSLKKAILDELGEYRRYDGYTLEEIVESDGVVQRIFAAAVKPRAVSGK